VRPVIVLSLLLFLPALAGAVVINEIMYNPQCNDDYCEWLELYNPASESVDLSAWTVCNIKLLAGYINHTDRNVSLNNGMLLQPNQHAIITDGVSGTLVYDNFNVNAGALALHTDAGSICGGLSNSGKTITLKSPDGSVADNVTYSDDADENYSLERNASGWFPSSVISGTPGATNSILSQQQNGSQSQPPPTDQQAGQQTQHGTQQTSQTNLTNVSMTSQIAVTGNIVIELVGPPREVEADSAFTLKIKLFNNFSVTKKLEVSSYAFFGQNLATEGGWEPNAYTVVLEPSSIHFIDLLNDIKPDVNGTFKLRASAFDGNLTWDTEVPLVVVEPESEPEQLAQTPIKAGSGPTGAFMIGGIDLIKAMTDFLGGLWGKITSLLPFI